MNTWQKHKEASRAQDRLERLREYQRARNRRYGRSYASADLLEKVKDLQRKSSRL